MAKKEYIDRAELMKRVENQAENWGEDYDAWQILGDIEDFPAADVAPVARGQWKTALLEHEAFGERPRVSYCSVCNQIVTFRTFFCPNCGARMDLKEADNAV